MNQVQVVWDEPARENGARVDQYWLEGWTDQSVREKRDTNLTLVEALTGDQDWVLYYNGSSKQFLRLRCYYRHIGNNKIFLFLKILIENY